ncbi:MAG: PilZ domain-containing protein [Gammaproteobacteria bacterium]|nr:PilZ domain-containing protein [Gammaproteobacteria bacterium]MCP5137168.1 PilZ domain-containing protein [Gammaproteobacteria bacterium]
MSTPNKPAMGRRQGVLSLNIKDKNTLYNAYMPHLSDGGLFVPSNKPYRLGDEVFLLISLLDEAEKLAVPGTVVWITPVGAAGSRPPGIGVQFKDGGTARNKIDTLIPGAIDNDRPTHTL